jgi:hypothetical protein
MDSVEEKIVTLRKRWDEIHGKPATPTTLATGVPTAVADAARAYTNDAIQAWRKQFAYYPGSPPVMFSGNGGSGKLPDPGSRLRLDKPLAARATLGLLRILARIPDGLALKEIMALIPVSPTVRQAAYTAGHKDGVLPIEQIRRLLKASDKVICETTDRGMCRRSYFRLKEGEQKATILRKGLWRKTKS